MANRGGQQGRGNRGRGRAPPMVPYQERFKPHMGIFPQFTLPEWADGVRVTHINGVTEGSYHFPGGNWVPVSGIPGEQARCFSESLRAKAAALQPAVNFAANDTWQNAKDAAWVAANHSYAEWKAALKAAVWQRIFPPRQTGQAGP